MGRNPTGKLKAVVLQSDDWGFCGWTPNQQVAEALGYTRLPSPHQHYGNSGLECASGMERIFGVLESITDGAGLPAVMQPNYIVGVPDYDRMINEGYSTWHFRNLEAAGPPWNVGGILEQARNGIRRGIWRPEYHGNTHCAGELVLRRCRSGDREATLAMSMHCPPLHDLRRGAEYAGTTRRELYAGVTTFARLFGYEPVSTVPPNYVINTGAFWWWRKTRIRVIQALDRLVPTNRIAKCALRLIQRSSALRCRAAFLNSKRDFDFEPRGGTDGNGACAAGLISRIKERLSRGTIIGIGTHRLNYIHHSSAWVERSLGELHSLLAELVVSFPDLVFLTDSELYQLHRSGVSVSRRGEWLVLRNSGPSTVRITLKGDEYPELLWNNRIHTRGITVSRGSHGYIAVTIPPGNHKTDVN